METYRDEVEPSLKDEYGSEEIKALLNRWGKENFFRVKGWGDQITVTSVRPLPSYVLTLETQYEHRSLETRRVPWDGGPVDVREAPPGLWEVEAPAPEPFESHRVECTPIPHTDAKVDCEGCSGLGRVDCPACKGSGRFRRGAPTEKGCSHCGSRGWIDHPPCAGKGHFREFRVVVSSFTCRTAEEKLFSVPLPEKLFKKAERETLIDHRRKGGGFAPPDPYPEMGPALESLWEQSVPKDPGETRILFQRYRIERIKGWEVQYESPAASSPGKLWILGDQQVIAPGAPRAWGRILGVSIPAAALLGSAMFVLVASLLPFLTGSRRNPPVSATPKPPRVTVVRTSERIPGTPNAKTILAASGSAMNARMRKASGDSSGGGELHEISPEEENRDDSSLPSRPASRGEAQSEDTGASSENPVADPADDAEDEESSPPEGYEVVAGIYSDEEDALEAAEQIEDADYDPMVQATQGPGGTLRVVSIQGFDTREEAEEAVRDLRERGISRQFRIVPIYTTAPPLPTSLSTAIPSDPQMEPDSTETPPSPDEPSIIKEAALPD